MERHIVITMKAFEQELSAGRKQADLLERAAELSDGGVEIRRELLRDIPGECREIRRANRSYGHRLIYSVPDTLFRKNRMDLAQMEQYAGEAADIGADTIKLSTGLDDLGDVRNMTAALKSAAAVFSGAGVHLTVENDQTAWGGKCETVRAVLAVCRQNHLPVGHTFDTANWLYVGEDPYASARSLAPYVDYIHLKDAKQTPTGLVAAFPGKGLLDWRRLLNVLPAAPCPVGLEFQIDDLSEAKTLIGELKQPVFAGR